MKQLIAKSLFISFFVCSVYTQVQASPGRITENFPVIYKKLPGTGIRFFNAHRQGRGITLQWVAENVQSFEILYSFDGEFFDSIDEVIPGNSNRNVYHMPDVFPGYHYFRIKAKNMDGTEELSEVATLRIVQRK